MSRFFPSIPQDSLLHVVAGGSFSADEAAAFREAVQASLCGLPDSFYERLALAARASCGEAKLRLHQAAQLAEHPAQGAKESAVAA